MPLAPWMDLTMSVEPCLPVENTTGKGHRPSENFLQRLSRSTFTTGFLPTSFPDKVKETSP